MTRRLAAASDGPLLLAIAAALLAASASGQASAAGAASRVGRAELGFTPSFTTASGRSAHRSGILDGTLAGPFGPGGGAATAAFLRLEVTTRWPVVTGTDVRDHSGYLLYLVTDAEAASGGRASPRLRMGDSTYRLVDPREAAAALLGDADGPLSSRLPAMGSLSSADIDGDGRVEILAFFRRKLAMAPYPEIRLHVLRIEGRALVEIASIPVLVPDVSEDFDFWGFLVGEVTFVPATADAAARIDVVYERTRAAPDQRTDAAPPNEAPPRAFTLLPPHRAPLP